MRHTVQARDLSEQVRNENLAAAYDMVYLKKYVICFISYVNDTDFHVTDKSQTITRSLTFTGLQ